MSAHLSTDDWWLVAAGVTVAYTVAMYWCMPTPRAKRRVLAAPLVGWMYLVPNAVLEGYSVSQTLYFYSCALAMFIVMVVPVASRVASDIAEQERKPWDKVPLNTFALYWTVCSATVCIAGAVFFWPFLA
ncbi:hypothetical protein [Streptomyces sp. NPDC096324]|uniref:hypothetical protein n=1 Tax=Streptomyces sp. NPDC096324 TaxID=3366085 RepID=UPI0037F70AD3